MNNVFVGVTAEVVQAYRALCVVALDKTVRAFLEENDPKCLRQAEQALSVLERTYPSLPIPESRRKYAGPDFVYRDEGSVMLLAPQTDDARDWVEHHIPEDAQWFGNYIGIDRRCFQPILDGIDGDGLTFCPEGEVTNYSAESIGECPACHKPVYAHQDAVWTCAHNLSPTNPAFIPPASDGACGGCEEALPLHGKCYDDGTW
jgi:hypothetical protein